MSKLLGTLTGEGFESEVWLESDGRIWFVADLDIDADGGANPDHDPDWQPDTSYHHNGKPIDAERVPGVVVPGWLVQAVAPVVLGCKARVTNLRTRRAALAIVHDTGPQKKNGEGTPELARRISINPHSRTGGEDFPAVLYEIFPGAQVTIDGIEYALQKS